jgi:hypothetical protein
LGVTFDAKKSLVCVDKGGYIEVQQPPPQKVQVNGSGAQTHANGTSNGSDIDNTAASLLDQYGGGSLSGTPGGNISIPPLSQPPSQSQSAVGTPGLLAGNSAQHTTFDQQTPNLDVDAGNDLLDLDVEMSGMTNVDDKPGEEWVVVDDQASSNAQQASNNAQSATTTNAQPAISNAVPPSNVDADTGSMFDTVADFGGFDNLDTAGDALADYGHDDTMDLGDLVDDSAFGDAFHEMHNDETTGDNA